MVSLVVAAISQLMQRRLLTVKLRAERENLAKQLNAQRDDTVLRLQVEVERQVAQQLADRENLERQIENDVAMQMHKLVAEREIERHRLELAHEFKEREKLLDLVGEFRGRIVEASDVYNHRLLNLYGNANQHWLSMNGDYSVLGYYFHSTVLRFLALLSLATQFERKAFFIEEQVAEDPDEQATRDDAVTFLWYCKGLRWAATDVSLFEGASDYERSGATDHFFSDQLRDICARIMKEDGTQVGLGEFVTLSTHPQLLPAMRFFDGLRPDEDRHRWDRLVALHLLVMSFLNWYGYDRQHSDAGRLDAAAGQLRHGYVAANLRRWLPQLGLDKHAGDIDAALARRTARRETAVP